MRRRLFGLLGRSGSSPKHNDSANASPASVDNSSKKVLKVHCTKVSHYDN